MSHAFDTGLTLPQRTVVRRGAVEVLSPLKRSNGGYLADVKSFGGVVRTYTDEPDIELLQKALGNTPSIGVALATRQFRNASIMSGRTLGSDRSRTQPQAISELQLLLYFADQHGRDGLTGRHESDSVAAVDDTADPGLDVMMEHAIELMHGTYPTTVVGTVKQIEIEREEELATLPHVTIWLQTYKLTLHSYTGGREFRTAEQLIDSLHWRVTTDLNEPNRPAPAVASSTVDADSDP
jgi:hypothetical protein